MEQERIKKIGLCIIVLAFLLNPYFIGVAFSEDHHIENPVSITLITGFEVFLGLLGAGLYYKEKIPKNVLNNGTLFVISSLFCFAVLEGAITFLGEYDADGQFSFGGRD